jgi:ketopantoate reductase
VRAASAKALEFRNGAVLRLADDLGIGVPVTARLLAAAGHLGSPGSFPGS